MRVDCAVREAARTPLGKVLALETPAGFISESRAIFEYIERAFPERPLLPGSPFGAAKVQRVRTDAAADQPGFMAHLKALYGI